MDDMRAAPFITALRKKWILYTLLVDLCIAVGIAFVTAVFIHTWYGLPLWWGIVAGAIVFMFLLIWHRVWRIEESMVAQWLNQTYPQLQESAGLLLHAPPTLNMLEQLQYKKTGAALLAINSPLQIRKRLVTPVCVVAALLIAGFVLIKFAPAPRHETIAVVTGTAAQPVKKEIRLPEVANINVTITPPPYTRKPPRVQHAFNVVAEEGSVVEWQLQTNIAASTVNFIFNDTRQKPLHTTGAAHTQWDFQKKVDSSGFYQLNIDGRLSELYKLETIADRAPVVHMQSPKQYTTIDFGEPQQVKLITALNDDYGVQDAFIAATIASGSGEAVKFKEQKIGLKGFTPGKTQYDLQQVISLQALGMQPGDELYFYIQATDNHRQQTRSDIHIVHLPDTAQLMSLEGLANSLTLKPEYFRSQRQIIIDAEQLLKDRDTISEQRFKDRSNNLGIDQKLLRLRYGKFLGDESSGETEGADGLGDIADFSNAEKVMDAFTDHHDNAEDATYLDPDTKKQLRAILNQMWDSELRLRTFTPRDALPFAYKALRLLKDLQQKSRVYVAKASFKTTPLDLKKRLTGDLTKIKEPLLQKDITQQPDPQQPVREALAMLEEMKLPGKQLQAVTILQQANLRLHEMAVQQPAVYLKAVEAMKRILAAAPSNARVATTDILIAQAALQQLLTVPVRMPAAGKSSSRQHLAEQYFRNLQNRQP